MRKALLSTAALAAILTITAASAQERTHENHARDVSPSQSQSVTRQAPARAAQERQPAGARNERGTGMAAEPQSQHQTVGQGEARGNESRGGQQAAKQAQGQNEDRHNAQQPAAADRSSSDRDRQAQGSQEHRRSLAEPKSRDAQSAAPGRNERNARGSEPKDHERNARDNESDHNGRNEKSATSNRPAADRNGASERRASEHNNAGSKNAESRHEGAQSEHRNRAAESTRSTRSNTWVSERDRTRIRESISRLHVRPLTRVNFSVAVGVRVPGSISLYPLPAEFVAIYPQYRGYDFVVVHDQIAVIEPSTHKIVRLLPYAEEPRAASRGSSGSERVRLSDQQRQVIRRTVTTRETTAEAPSEEVTIGEELPSAVIVHEFPETVYEDAPELRSYRYIVRDHDIYLVDPGDRRVIETIR